MAFAAAPTPLAGPTLNVTDMPDLWIAGTNKFEKKERFEKGHSRRNPRVRRGPGNKMFEARVPVVHEEEEMFSDSDGNLTDAEAVEETWTCSQCTFENNFFMPQCEMCNARRVRNTAPPAVLKSYTKSASEWPSLPQGRAPSWVRWGSRGAEQWDNVSTASWVDVAGGFASLEENDDACSVTSFVNIGDSEVKREASDEDDTKSLSSSASFLVVGQALESQEASAGAATGTATTWAARVAAAAARVPAPAPGLSSFKAAQASGHILEKVHLEKVPNKVQVHDGEQSDESDGEGTTWGRRGQVHRGRQWQKHRRRVER